MLGLLYYFFDQFSGVDASLASLLVYVPMQLMLRRTVGSSHRKGSRLARQQQYTAAIPFFLRSLTYFNRHRWVDNYRFVTLLSVSNISYREMALYNLGYCYAQVGDKEKALIYLQQTLALNPDNKFAKDTLALLKL
ncbi:MAG TPA: tetratricopeptide repeat protein [Chitinophagaceae bacterium]|nr:tetratricopeptide repeat protein [Chitinophagaceae bacterium]